MRQVAKHVYIVKDLAVTKRKWNAKILKRDGIFTVEI